MSPDIFNRFTFHPAKTPERAKQHDDIRDACRALASVLDYVLPPGREKACAITKLEEAMFWANAAVARQGDPA
ncbi:hypothetical protein ACIBKY_52135 [Nonomuraea sp. NPDC050394]|uniref:Acb2/Tad1 domain-containing protein n=1 Tax=Nonomuraea sp. NPDC050394 TaxID=3364363 RepID=UPI0037A1C9C4